MYEDMKHNLREELLRFDRVSAEIKSVPCLQNISFSAYSGECLMFLSAEGIPCSRMVGLLSGELPFNKGNIYLWDRSRALHAPDGRIGGAISVIGENARLIDSFSIMENLYLPERYGTFFFPSHRRRLYDDTKELFNQLGLEYDPSRKASRLSVFEQHMVLAAKAISNLRRIILFDNVTSAYADKDIARFCESIERMKRLGVAVLVMARSVTDAVQAADRIMVLRKKTIAHIFQQGTFNRSELFHCMTCQRQNRLESRAPASAKVKLRLLEFAPRECFCKPMDIPFREGNITGLLVKDIAVGVGIAQSLFGMRAYDGKILIDENIAHIGNTNAAIENGIGLLQSNASDNLLLNISAMENIKLLAYKRTSGFLGNLRARRVHYLLQHMLEMFPISESILEAKDIRKLSEMELMQLSIAKWFMIGVKIMVVLYPYSQLDEAHRLELNALLFRMKSFGMTVILLLALTTDVEMICDEVIIC